MKQVIQNTRNGQLTVKDVPPPKVRAGHILVRTGASLISAGTERMVVDFAQKSLAGKARQRPDLVKKVLGKLKRDGIRATLQSVLARLDEPLPLGYSAAGHIVAVGSGLEGRFHVGERVAVAGAGIANHAELNVVPANLAAAVPDGVPLEEACYGTLGAIALHSVRNLGAGLGDVVAVVGAGLVGQIAAQFLSLQGARVIALDYNPDRLRLARNLGAEAAFNLSEPDVEGAVAAFTRGLGCDAILIAAATESAEPFHTAAALARDRARVCMVGMTGTEFPYQAFMKKELNLIVSRSYGPGRYDPDFENKGIKYPEGWVRWTETENLAECLRLLSADAPRRLNVATLTTHRFALNDAEAAYGLVTGSHEAHLGVILTYPEPAAEPERPSFAAPRPAAASDGLCRLGVIGAGGFARSVLLPELKKMKGVHLETIATHRGANARQAADAFGFAHAAADEAAVLDDPAINAVLIATRHDSHAELAVRALEAGKAVLVEKPLGLTADDIHRVAQARNSANGFFQIGFNRRFAPLVIKMRNRLSALQGPKFVLMRVNAGAVPDESWIMDPDEGGGRILGEACHFVDLARYLIGSPVVSVNAEGSAVGQGPLDDVTITLRFGDGSLATVAYTGLGDSGVGKERIEAYGGGTAIILDNYQRLTVSEDGRARTETARADKGIAAALDAFVRAVATGGPAPIDEGELVETSLATTAVLDSLRAGTRIDL